MAPKRLRCLAAVVIAAASTGCSSKPSTPHGGTLPRHAVSISVLRSRLGANRSVVQRNVDGVRAGPWRTWDARLDVFEGPSAWRTRCVYRPVANGVAVPDVMGADVMGASAGASPELVCWTLPESESGGLALVIDRGFSAGTLIMGGERLRLVRWDVGGAFRVERDGRVVAAFDPNAFGCDPGAYYEDSLDDRTKTAVLFAVSALAWLNSNSHPCSGR